MFAYYLKLGFVHLRRNPVLTALMVVTLAVGVAASMSTLTILHAMSSDPIPQKSDRLFVPLLDSRPLSEDGADPPDQLTYREAMALRKAGPALRRTALMGVAPAIDPGQPGRPPFFSDGLAIHSDFFAMMDVPFARGGPWTPADDDRAARVVVLKARLAARLFGDGDPVGRTVRLNQKDHVVSGVVPDDWRPVPKFYRLVAGSGAFGGPEELFMPYDAAIAQELDQQGSVNCYSDADENSTGYEGLKQSECVWVQFWVELAHPGDAAAYRDFLAGYVAEQRKLGRFPRPDNNRLHDVRQWMEARQVVARDTRLQTWLAFGFLAVCLVNTIGLLLAKFTARAGEIGVRRALGAGRGAVFQQYLTEAGVVGLVGGVIGLALTFGALWLLGRQSTQLAMVARMDWQMLATTFALAVGASLLAGLLPTWRACQVQPALQLKSQ
jgi:putative ABC transport system permease protein